MKKKIIILLVVFSSLALLGSLYLVYSLEARLSDFTRIIMLYHAKNMRERLLLDIQTVRMDLDSELTAHPESRIDIQTHLADMTQTVASCSGCHHTAEVTQQIEDLKRQVDAFEREITSGRALSAEINNTQRAITRAHRAGSLLTSTVERMVMTTSQKLRAQTEDSLRKAQRLELVMFILIAAGPLIMVVFAVMVMRGVTGPVQVLLTATRRLKKGDLQHRIAGLKDEFGELGVSFNDMAESLAQTMRAIEESEKRYRLLFEGAADAIFILEAEGDQAGKILQANQAAAKMHGFSIEELRQMRIQELDVPEVAALAPERIRRIVKGTWIKAEGAHCRKDGAVFPVEINAGLLEIAGRKYIMAIDRDLTERKQVEKELQKAERVRISGELATGLAHEIKNPLAGIKVSMEALSGESYLSDEDREMLNKVVGEIQRIEFLMRGLLNFANPPKPQLLSTDINAVLRTVASLVLKEGACVRNNGSPIQLTSDLEAGLPHVMADPMQLQQVFMNLLLNAIDAMPEGGSLLMKTASDSRAGSVIVELSDTGTGIQEEDMARIFDPFFTTKEKGTGLGLSITRRLVEEHGGIIRLQNNKEGGVTSMVTLPIEQHQGEQVS